MSRKRVQTYEGLLTEIEYWKIELENVGVILHKWQKIGDVQVWFKDYENKWDLKEMPYGIYPRITNLMCHLLIQMTLRKI